MSEAPVEAAPSPLDAARELLGTEEAPEEESGPEETAVEEPEGSQHEAVLPDLDVEVPEDYQELSGMPDFDAEAEAEVQHEEHEQQEEDDYQYQDESVVAERKKRIAAEKRAAWLEQRNVEQNIGKWKAEAIKYYPLAQPFIDAGLVKADSRRAFAREAKRVHETMKPYISEKFLKPLEEALKAREVETKDESTQQQRDDWGPARTGPNQVPAAATRTSEAYEGRQRAKTLVDEIKTMFTAGGE